MYCVVRDGTAVAKTQRNERETCRKRRGKSRNRKNNCERTRRKMITVIEITIYNNYRNVVNGTLLYDCVGIAHTKKHTRTELIHFLVLFDIRYDRSVFVYTVRTRFFDSPQPLDRCTVLPKQLRDRTTRFPIRIIMEYYTRLGDEKTEHG